MKKLSAMVMAGVMALGMVGCGSTAAEAPAESTVSIFTVGLLSVICVRWLQDANKTTKIPVNKKLNRFIFSFVI